MLDSLRLPVELGIPTGSLADVSSYCLGTVSSDSATPAAWSKHKAKTQQLVDWCLLAHTNRWSHRQPVATQYYHKVYSRLHQKHTESPPELPVEFNFASILYTLNTHPCGPNFTPFRSTTSHFQDTRLSKIGNAPNDPRMTLST